MLQKGITLIINFACNNKLFRFVISVKRTITIVEENLLSSLNGQICFKTITTMISLKIIIASTRQGRKGPLLADWIFEKARAHSEFDVEVIDLAAVNLPFMDEPNHPRLKQYTHQHTKDWSTKIASADAFILVTPEYNHGYPATIKNAIDFLYHEWRHKPIGFVSYGGIAGGTRAIQLLKPVLACLEMTPLTAAVNVPFFTKYIQDDKFTASDEQNKMAAGLFAELKTWSGLLNQLRTATPEKVHQ